jgi:hypothetical protein
METIIDLQVPDPVLNTGDLAGVILSRGQFTGKMICCYNYHRFWNRMQNIISTFTRIAKEPPDKYGGL